jgi:hypothetical protein
VPEDTIPILAKSGDPLEQEICKHVDDLRPLLQPYSEIWFNHVAIRRVLDNSTVEKDWMNFAGSHYSAIVRVFHARDALKKLEPLVLCEAKEEDVGRILLDVHREWASFWEHIGSSIDNLALAFEDSVPPIIKDDGREVLMRKYEDVAYAYNRRTQFIHSRIVPAKVKDNMVQFRARITERRQRRIEPKESRWDLPYDSEHVLGDILEVEWKNFINVMTDVWSWLRTELRERDLAAKDLKAKKLEGANSRQIQDLYIEIPDERTPISNISMPRELRIETQEVRIPNFLDAPPPSGQRPG